MILITYYVEWGEHGELCPECGQPDNCGDCDHTPLPHDEVIELGGRFIPERGEAGAQL